MLRNKLKMIKIYRNMSEFWWTAWKNIILILVHLLITLKRESRSC